MIDIISFQFNHFSGKLSKGTSGTKDDENKTARIFGLLPISTINRNKEGIHSSTKSINPEIISCQIQKTSIKINLEESLTSVNVNEQGKYLTSVMISDDSSIKNQQFSYQNRRETNSLHNKSYIKLKNDSKTLPENESVMNNNEVRELISTNYDKTKTLICLNYKHGSDAFEKKSLNCKTSNDRSDSFILKIMSDPYLAHLFCGSEVTSTANIINKLLANQSDTKKDLPIGEYNDEEIHVLKRLEDVFRDENCRLEPKISLSTTTLSSKSLTKRNNVVSDKFKVSENLAKSVNSAFLKSNETRTIRSSNYHEYESVNCDPIYEEIIDNPPPLPKNPPPAKDIILEKQYKPMFSGATKNDILSYLVDAKDRVNVPEESYTFKFLRQSSDDAMTSEKEYDNKSLNKLPIIKCAASIERNDSGVGSETSKTSRNKYQSAIENSFLHMHLCEDCGMRIH